MVKRCVIIGGDAAGMTAASTLRRRRGDAAEVVVIERGGWTSYSACGIPYWIAGDVASAEDLVARSPAEHRERGIDVRLGWEATSLDVAARTVTAIGPDGSRVDEPYDELLIATGARPRTPDVPGADAEGIVGIKTLDDGEAFAAELDRRRPERVVIIGGGYIGVEMAETCVRRGLHTSVIDRNDGPLKILDPELGAQVAEKMAKDGVHLRFSTELTGFDVDDAGRVSGVRLAEDRLDADLVIVAAGVVPNAGLATAAGLPQGDSGGIRVDATQRVADGVWAAGDCIETHHRITGSPAFLPLGTHANKQGLIAGENIAAVLGGDQPDHRFPGVVGTAITQFGDLQIGATGLNTAQAAAAGFDVVSATIESTTITGYMPGAEPITVRMTGDRRTGRVLGGQILGGAGSTKRVDTIATALWHEATLEDVMMSDLSYVPPISGVWDPVQIAARAVISQGRA